ncbi:MAG TPA: TonB-dependent receptor [Nitrospira sp.]|nr:TonB-dependent receptor [Nitrospira sp.]
MSSTALPAMAQSSALEGIEEIVVTAQKREQSIMDVGISITAFSGDMLRARGVDTAENMALLTPGLTVTDNGATGVPTYTIRGVGFSDYSTGASSTVGLYFDEIAIPYTVMSRGALFDLERAEVLKGPQGDLYGRNTTAGQINFISKRPTEEFEAGLSMEYARFGVLDAEGYVSGGITDSAQARLAYKVTQSNSGWQQSLTRDDTLGAKDVVAIRGSVNLDINESASLLLSANYTLDQSENLAFTAYDGLDVGFEVSEPRPGLGTPPFSLGDNRAADWAPGEYRPRRDNELKGIMAHLDWTLGSFDLTSITGYNDFNRDEWNDRDGSSMLDANNRNISDIEVFSQEMRLSSEANSNLTWIVGGYYSWDQMAEDYNFFMNESYFARVIGVEELDTRYDQTTESIAGFAHVEWQFAEDLRLVLGARYTKEDRKWSGCTYDSDGTLANTLNTIVTPFLIIPAGLPDPGLVAPGGCGVYNDIPGTPNYGTYAVFSDKITNDPWMWKAGLNYEPTDDVLLFATLSTGFKSGGFNGANANTHQQLQPYEPEELLSVEAGIKSSLLDNQMRLNASVFWYDYEDKQEQDLAVTFVGNISGLTNVPKSKIYGSEVEIRWLPLDGLTIDFGGTYLSAKVKEWNAVSADSNYPDVVTFDVAGLKLDNAPEWQFNSTAIYEWSVTDDLQMFVGGDATYKSSTSGAGRPERVKEGYSLFNARTGIESIEHGWRVSVWGRNIFDEYYYTSAFLGANGPYVRFVGMPATYGVTLDVMF